MYAQKDGYGTDAGGGDGDRGVESTGCRGRRWGGGGYELGGDGGLGVMWGSFGRGVCVAGVSQPMGLML